MAFVVVFHAFTHLRSLSLPVLPPAGLLHGSSTHLNLAASDFLSRCPWHCLLLCSFTSSAPLCLADGSRAATLEVTKKTRHSSNQQLAIKNHLLVSDSCRELYRDDVFSVLARGRSV